MKSFIFIAIVFSFFFIFADATVSLTVPLEEACKSFVTDRDTYKADLEVCKTALAAEQKKVAAVAKVVETEIAKEKADKPDAEKVLQTAKTEEIVKNSTLSKTMKKKVAVKAEAVYKSYVQEDGETLKKFAELESFFKIYSEGLKKWEAEVDQRLNALEKKVSQNSVDIIVLKEEQKIQGNEIAAVAKKVENSRIKFEIFLNGGYTTVEKGMVNLGAGTLIPVGKNRLFDIELGAYIGIATNSEMGIVGFLAATPFVMKEWKGITLSLVPEVNFTMVIDILGNSGNENQESQKGKMSSYTTNGAIGIKSLFGEYWFLNAKFIMGYAYVVDPKSYEDKNSFNFGFLVGGGVQF